MLNILKHSVNTYFSNIYLIILSSLSFVIALIIPLFASFPTYNDIGGVLLRTASIYLNLNPFNTAIIVISVLFSLLFLSFAMVAINIVVKHSRTQTKIRAEVIRGIEKYTGNVFVILFIATIVMVLANILTFNSGYSGIITVIVALAITPFVFYAPASIVIDDAKLLRSVRASLKFFVKRFDYFIVWLVIALVLLTFFDFVFITVSGTALSRYVMLIFSSLFILPFLVLLQGELYISRFKLLKG
ncbi:MAG: hypothetical protein KGI06_02425 [Candidatus Micrarchaeota archaeon]|nr:hypothetical protein [Candidatus Micrarchaeota archaeon]